MMKTYLLLFLFNLTFSLPSAALSFTHLGIERGLSNNYVTALAQDARGCLWIATESGLNQFDGYTVSTYKSSNSELKHEALNALYYDRKNNILWIGGKFEGVYALDCTTYRFTYFTRPGGKPLDNVGGIAPAGDGGIWMGAGNGGLIHYSKSGFTPLRLRGYPIPNGEKRCIYDDGKGHVYIGYTHKGLILADLKEDRMKHFTAIPGNAKSLPGNSVYAICRDSKNNLWIGTNQGLALFNPAAGTFTTFRHSSGNPYSLAADHIYDIREMDNGELWIASDIGGISILNINDLTFKRPSEIRFRNILPANTPDGLSSGNIRSLLMDMTGNIWIGNYGSGVDFASHRNPLFNTLPYMTGGPYPKAKSVWGLCISRGDDLWVGSENEIALFRHHTLVETIDISHALTRPYGQVFSMIDTGDGNLLLGIYDDGLLKYDTKSRTLTRLNLEKSNTDVITFYRDTDGSIWIGTEYGLYHYAQGKIEKSPLNAVLWDKSIYGIVRDRQGKLWIGGYSGVAVFDKKGRQIAHLDESNRFCSNAINHLTMDSKGGIWIATRNGVGYVPDTRNPRRFFCYGSDRGLADNYVRSVQEDADGNIWLSTNNTISLWNKRELTFDNYNFRDGIPAGNFIEGSSVTGPDGTLYFGTLKGACYFNPHALLNRYSLPPVQIIACKGLNNLTADMSTEDMIPFNGQRIELPHDRNSFRISFSVPDYALSSRVEYAYRLKGTDDKWTNTLGENSVTFRSLPYGHYTFQVKARLKNQTWDEAHIATLDIHIRPPFWWTWYARIIYLLVLAAIVSWGIRLYKRRLQLRSALEVEKKKNKNEQELNEERLRFYTNITHELRTPLTLILGPLEDLAGDRKLPAPYQSRIHMIYGSARRLLELITQLLEFRKTETQNRRLTVAKEDLGQLVTETGLRFKELNRNDKVRFDIRIDMPDPVLYFDRDILTTVLNNLLGNAVKYTPQGTISILLHAIRQEGEPEYAEIVVKDTGYGIDKDALPHIFDRYYQAKGTHQASGTGIGLALVRSLVHLHEGLLHVESEPGKGTMFTVRLRMDATYPQALHREAAERPAQAPEPQQQDKRILLLVVEDNADIRNYIASSFDESYRILTAANGQEGWEQAAQHIPDLIISDIMMPVMDGIALCRKVKEDIRTSHIPVILLTAKDSLQDKEEGYDVGADSYLTKPFSAKLLHSRVRNLLENRKRLADLLTGKTDGTLFRLPGHRPDGLNKVSEEFLKKFIATVEENAGREELDMPYMADKMNMSHSTLYRKIKGLTGMSGNEFIRKIKLRYSIRLIDEQGLTISEAAYSSGFNDVGYYRRCFKAEYGQTPSEYLKNK